jgi:hypothetical protein
LVVTQYRSVISDISQPPYGVCLVPTLGITVPPVLLAIADLLGRPPALAARLRDYDAQHGDTVEKVTKTKLWN